MPLSNSQGRRVSRAPFLVIIVFTIIANENGLKMMRLVEGRTWPRIVQRHKEEIYLSRSSTPSNAEYRASSSSLLETPKSEINSSLSPILPAPLHLEKGDEGKDDGGNNRSRAAGDGGAGDYQDFNGNVSLECSRRPPSRHHYNHEHHSRNTSSSGSNNNDDYNGHDGGRWWTSTATATNSTNCLAGPFHLGADVNETVYNALCPLSFAATNGKFPMEGVRCGNGGELFTVCTRDKAQGSGAFTLHQCSNEQSSLDAESGGCERKLERGKIKTSLSCPIDRDETGVSDDEILHWAFLQTQTPVGLAVDESKTVERVVEPNLQNLVEETDVGARSTPQSSSSSSSSDDGGSDDFGNLCKSTFSAYNVHHGLHPHPRLCQKYIHCSADGSGSFFLKECGPGTVFNPELLICDWPANVPHCSSQNGGNELLRRRRRSPLELSAPDEGNLRQQRCDFTGIRADPQFCNKYRLCSAGGVESVHTCGLGTVFNQHSGVCDFADEVDCASRRSDLGTYGCDKGDKYRAPHPDYCNKFIECETEVLAVKSCPPGTLYDREAERCDHTFRVTCRKPISLEHDIDVNWKSHGAEHVDDQPESDSVLVIKRKRRSVMLPPNYLMRTVRENKLNLACEFNYIAPHPNSCTRFVECENKRLFVKSCGPGTAFNPLLGQCDWPHNVREADERDCTRYRQCSIQHGYQTRFCRQGEFFDEEAGKCVRGTSYQIQQCSRRTTTTTYRPTFGPPPPA